ncbi:DUF960 family protein [Proteiniclasticum sp. C24MP]|uniref:DUF960 family protein n=1 Tax=Proteiniclasticum sp. C24MP TaxID=3374101 RepID=UPI00375471D8
MSTMFRGQRYLTRGIRDQIDINLQVAMWRMIENLKCEVDYLQIFEIEQMRDNQVRITHSQEEPEYKSIIVLSGEIRLNKVKVYVIDEQDFATMLLADEY